MKYIKTFVALSVVTALTACSPDEQDTFNENQSAVMVNGAVIDPFISNAIVFADYDNDGVLDSFEPWAFTDANGYYSTGKNGEDYCTDAPKYCLELANDEPVKLVAVGGYDTTSLKKVKSRLSRMYRGSGNGPQYITPLTSVGDMSIDDANTIDQDVNIMIDALETENDAFSVAFKLHKIVELISAIIEQEYPVIGDDESFPVDLTGYVYDAINSLGQEEQLSVTAFLEGLTQAQLTTIVTTVREKLDELTLNSEAVNTQQLKSGQGIVSTQYLSKLPEILNTLSIADMVMQNTVAVAGTSLVQHTMYFTSSVRIIESVTINHQAGITSSEITDTIDNIYNNPVTLGHISSNYFDTSYINLSSIANLESSLTTMSERPKLPTDLTDMQLVLSENSESRDADVALFFSAENTLKACVRYIDNEDPSSSNNTSGTLLTGTWGQSEYYLDLTLTFAGTEKALRIKTKDANTYVFDYDDDEKDWSPSTDFAKTTADIPTTDAECQDWIVTQL